MANTFDKDMNIITNFLKDMDIIAALDDQPNDVGGLTAAELKAKFDEGGKAIQTYINETLIPEVLGLDGAESSRKQAETERAQAEAARQQAEAERRSAESGRAAAEAQRVQNESARVTAETARAQAEQQRADETAGIVAQATAQANSAVQQASSAANSASAAAGSASTATEKASAASGSAASAAASAAAAARDAQAAAQSERLSQSWAVGGTGQRAGEDTDNAKYWAGMAHTAAGGGVLTFHGRTGTVEPADGDYTPDMVGAIPAAQRGAADGIATLGADGKVPYAQLPDRFSVRSSRIVVGTSTAGWTEQECDFLCDGTEDQEELLAAIEALPDGGGTILLLDGTYWITQETPVKKSNVTIRGIGNGAVIQAECSGDGYVFALQGDYVTVSHLTIRGQDEKRPLIPNGIRLEGHYDSVEWVHMELVLTSICVWDTGEWATVQSCVVPAPINVFANGCRCLNNTLLDNPLWTNNCMDLSGSNMRVVGNHLDANCCMAVAGYDDFVANNYIRGPENVAALSLYGARLICHNNICAFRNDSASYEGKTLEMHASNSIVSGNIFMLKEPTEVEGTGNLFTDNLTVVG